MSTASRSGVLLVELLLLFVLLPVLYWLDVIPFHKMIPLVTLFLYCSFILIKHKRFNKETWSFNTNWTVLLLRIFLLLIALCIYLLLSTDRSIFADFSKHSNLFLMILLYPFLSAFPQEMIFRKFFFYRYESFFRNRSLQLAAGVFLFAFAHIYFNNWIVIGFTLVGGLLFSLTYLKTKSLLIVTIEHTLYGLMILSSGLADYFYKAF